MRKLTCSEFIFILFLFALALALSMMFLATTPVHAADIMPTVCRDTDYTSGIRYQFRNIPDSWINVTGYWYVADDGFMSIHTFVADALTSYPTDASGIKVGEAILGTSDNSLILRGNADTLPCDNPVQPGSTPQPTPCPAWAIDSSTGELVCLWSLPQATNG